MRKRGAKGAEVSDISDNHKEPTFNVGRKNITKQKNGRKNATEVIDEKQDSARYAERMNQTPRKGARHKDAKQAAVTSRGR